MPMALPGTGLADSLRFGLAMKGSASGQGSGLKHPVRIESQAVWKAFGQGNVVDARKAAQLTQPMFFPEKVA